MKSPLVKKLLPVLLLASCSPGVRAQAAVIDPATFDRTVLPIQQPAPALYTELDARKATPPPRFEVKAPAGAPNVVIILIDDMGFGMSSAFGGPVHMPTAERLATGGLRFNEFHTTALCSPTRTALLSGRNHHMNNMGGITEVATAFPGNTGAKPASVAPLAEMLRLNGYSTAQFGKNHETAAWETSISGPMDRWPTHSGFDKFYGFMGGEANQWSPLLFEGTTPIEIPHDPKYHLMTDLSNQATRWVQAQKSLTPDRPFFVYFAPGATHAPHHVPKEWIAKYRGKFDAGWDKMREEVLARQIALGVVPAGTPLAPKPEFIKDWAQLSADERKVFSRQMEVYAAFGEYADFEIGRFLDGIKETGQWDNTLVFYIIGDNGTSAEGGEFGLLNENSYFNRIAETLQDQLKALDGLGGPNYFNHFAAGWAVAGDTPFKWTKQVAGDFGGTRNPLIVSWPERIKPDGVVRQQWHHVIDVAPTILEAAHLPEPRIVNGTVQVPIQGVSMLYALAAPQAPTTHLTQYFEIAGNRGLYHDGWLARTIHRAAWEATPRHSLQDDVWELFDTRTDFSLVHDLAAREPAKLAELQALFMHEASINHVLPIDDRSTERLNAAVAGRPDLMGDRTSLSLYEGMVGMLENAFINTKNRSHTITADLVIPESGVEGVIIAQAGRFGGWSLYVKDGKPTYTYNYLNQKEFTITAIEALKPGKVTLRFDFAYEGGEQLGKGGIGKLIVNGKVVGEGRIDVTQAALFSLDEGADVGRDDGTPVAKAYASPFAFTGKILKVKIDLAPRHLSAAAEAELKVDESAISQGAD